MVPIRTSLVPCYTPTLPPHPHPLIPTHTLTLTPPHPTLTLTTVTLTQQMFRALLLLAFALS